MADFLICKGEACFTVTLKGRTAWALRQLMVAGAKGCTPIDNPAPRWSAYIFNLRRAGLDVETIHEAHRGAYPGHHARYVLHADVVELEPDDVE